MTFPSNELNLKDTEYYCQKCKTYVTLRTPNPKCETCGEILVVALRSLLDNSRITGNDELADRAYEPTRRTGKS
jgi:DNA-directed RNA polymerase subunit RPC12/RpoP